MVWALLMWVFWFWVGVIISEVLLAIQDLFDDGRSSDQVPMARCEICGELTYAVFVLDGECNVCFHARLEQSRKRFRKMLAKAKED